MASTFAMESVSLEAASIIVDAALAKGRALDLKPLGVAVLDPRGCLKAYKAEDGATLIRMDVAIGKAWGTLGMGYGGREMERRGEHAGLFYNALQAATGGRIIPVRGGVLIRNQAGMVVGAVGITGDTSENDEACALHGIKAAGLIADTGDPA